VTSLLVMTTPYSVMSWDPVVSAQFVTCTCAHVTLAFELFFKVCSNLVFFIIIPVHVKANIRDRENCRAINVLN
jgi:hypothetical protein